MKTVRIATRRSELALWQTRWVAAELKKRNPELEVEEVHVVTKGDKVTDRPLHTVGGKGLFVSEVEAYVARGEADLAVHSLKDVPGDVDLAEGCDLLCLPKREDPRDVLLTRDGTELMGLSAGSRVGTVSLRRISQLKAQRPDLAFETLRGNVPTRLGRLQKGDFDAIVLAASGLTRLGLLEGTPHQVLSPEVCLPAVGQGTLALEGRADNDELRALLAPLEDEATRLVTTAERALLRRLQGSCRVPIAGFAELTERGMRLRAMVGDVDGEKLLSASSDVYLRGNALDQARDLGQEVADSLIAQGAQKMMREAEATVLRRSQKWN
ncbi:MAG: hydroxymethylbilane synthase [Myxococcota bacterium]